MTNFSIILYGVILTSLTNVTTYLLTTVNRLVPEGIVAPLDLTIASNIGMYVKPSLNVQAPTGRGGYDNIYVTMR